jgi:hypothetical protein
VSERPGRTRERGLAVSHKNSFSALNPDERLANPV